MGEKIGKNILILFLFLIIFISYSNPIYNLEKSSITRGNFHIYGTFVINQNTIDPITGKVGQYGFNGDVIVDGNGTLIVENATMYFLCNRNKNFNLLVNGSLILQNSTLTIENGTNQENYSLNIQVNGNINASSKLDIYESAINFTWFDVKNKNSNIAIENSRFHRMGYGNYTGLIFSHSLISIRNSSIEDSYYGLYSIDSLGDMDGVKIENTSYGIFSYSPINITSSLFLNCTYGAYFNSQGIVDLENTSFMNGEYGIYFSNTRSILKNITLRGISWGVYLDNSISSIDNLSIFGGSLYAFDNVSLKNTKVKNSYVNNFPLFFVSNEKNVNVSKAGEIIFYNSTGYARDSYVSNTTIFAIMSYSRIYLENITSSNITEFIRGEGANISVVNSTIRGSKYGIEGDKLYLNLRNSEFPRNNYGIYLSYSSGKIENSKFIENYDSVWVSKSTFFIGNNYFENTRGIMLDGCTNSTISNNTFYGSGLYLHGDINNLWNSYTTNKIENNTVNDKPLIFLIHAKNYTIANAGEIICVDSANISIENLNLSYTDVGIQVLLSTDFKIDNVTTMSNWWHGVYVCFSSNISIYNSTSKNNGWAGFYFYEDYNISLAYSRSLNNQRGIESYRLNYSSIYRSNISLNYMGIESDDSHFSHILDNEFYKNDNYGVKLDRCTEIKILGNDFLYNHNSSKTFNKSTVQAYDNGDDVWNETIGNFWLEWASNNNSNDNNNDGIVDYPYPIDGGARDYRPLKNSPEPLSLKKKAVSSGKKEPLRALFFRKEKCLSPKET